MLAPERLLKLNPLKALKQMLSERWMGSKPEWFVIKEIKGDDISNDFIAVVELSNLYTPLEIRHKYKVLQEYIFTKLDIGMLNYKGRLKIGISSIKETPTLIDALNDYYLGRGDILFSESDFETPIAPLLPGNMVYKTSLGSFRWVGSLELLVETIKEHIDKYISRRECVLDHNTSHGETTIRYEIVDSLNKQNVGLLPIVLSEGWVDLIPGSLTVVDNESSQLNTKIDIFFGAGTSPYKGTVSITYGRKSFYKTYNRPVVIPTTVTNSSDIVDLINSREKSNVTVGELNLPAVRPSGKYALEVKPTSLSHVGHIWVHYE